MCGCGTSICAACPGCGGICGTCTCTESLSPCGFGCGLTGAPDPCCPSACPSANLPSDTCPTAGSNVDLSNLPLTSPSGDPNLEGLTPSAATTDNPPSPAQCPGAPQSGGSGSHGGSGGGSAKSNAGNGASSPHNTACANVSRLQSALNRFGTSLAALFGRAEQAKTGLETKTVSAITTPAFLLVVLIVGGLMLALAWGKEE